MRRFGNIVLCPSCGLLNAWGMIQFWRSRRPWLTLPPFFIRRLATSHAASWCESIKVGVTVRASSLRTTNLPPSQKLAQASPKPVKVKYSIWASALRTRKASSARTSSMPMNGSRSELAINVFRVYGPDPRSPHVVTP